MNNLGLDVALGEAWACVPVVARLAALGVSALLTAACSGGGPTNASPSGGGDVTVAYAVASGAQSGTATFTTHSTGQATGTLNTVSGATDTLSGSYSATGGSFTLNGGGYTFTGSISAANASGSFTGPNGGGVGVVTINGSIVAGDSISGTYVNTIGSGSFGASKAACTAAGSTTLAGEWATAQGTGTTITVALLQVGSALSGALTYTPTFADSQILAQQTATVTMTRQQ